MEPIGVGERGEVDQSGVDHEAARDDLRRLDSDVLPEADSIVLFDLALAEVGEKFAHSAGARRRY